MKLQKRKSKKFRTAQEGKRTLSVILTAALLLNPLGPVASFLAGGRAAAANYLPVPAAADFVLLNKVTANQSWNGYRSYSMGEDMVLTGSTGGTLINYEQGFTEMTYAHVYGGNTGWNAVFENKAFTGTTTEETVCRLGGYVYNNDGSTAYLGSGTANSSAYDESGMFTTDWLPCQEAKAVISGRGKAHVSHIWFVMADLTAPGEKGWNMEVRLEEGAPILWLTGKETVRPANDTITAEDLKKLKLRLGLVPRKNPGAEPIYVTAEAVKYKEDGSGLGFRVNSTEWSSLDGQEYQIINIQDATTESGYNFQLFSGGSLTVKRPLVDLAGNPVYFPSVPESTKAQGLYLDAQPPAAAAVKLSGTSVSASSQNLPDQWPEDIDRASLFSTKGNKLQMKVQLSELVVHPSAEDMKKISMSWNNLTRTTSRLTGIEDSYANGVNGGLVSTLVFEPITIRDDQPDSYQGKRIGANELYGAEYLRDYSGNVMAETGQAVDLTGVSPDCQNYLDTKGPLAEKKDILILNKTGQEAYYVVPLHIQDGADGVLAAGVAGQTGRIALTSYAGAPQMTYEYEVSNSAGALDNLSQRGTIGGEGNEIWSDFPLLGNADYYLHIKLSDITGKELSDVKGLTLKLQLSDIIGNVSTPVFPVTNLELDQVAPELVLSAQGVTVSSTAEGNEAVLKVLAQSSDLNGINRMEYQWTVVGGNPAENGWTIVSADRQEITETVSGENTVSRDLVVRAYDIYGNVTEKRITMAADLSRAVGRFRVAGDPQTPSADTDLFISGPTSTGTITEEASTRATVVIGSNTYVRIFKGDEQVSLLDQTATDWYQVAISKGAYTGVTPQASPDWSYYGDISVSLTSSLKDLTPAVGNTVDDSGDVTLFQDASLTVAYASRQEDVHSVSFGDVQDSAGQEAHYHRLSVGEKTYSYYKFDRTMAGARMLFTLTNAKIGGWAQKDVDFDASYAVLVKTDREGNPLGDEEISERASLSQGGNQVFSVPACDKDGNPFASGAYALKVFVKQKAGGEQTFLGTVPLLLDSAGVPTQFGILSYDKMVRTVYGDNDLYNLYGVSMDQTAEEGDVLHTINVPVAKPDGFGMTTAISEGLNGRIPGTIGKIDGHTAYLTEVQNALKGSRASGSAPDIELLLSARWSAEEEPGKWLGNVLGRASGIKFWNAASSGDPADLPYVTASPEDYNTSSNTRIRFDFNPKWYDEGVTSDVVSQEELAAKTLDDFALALGSNTICYQLEMENGLVSPVYQFELNLCDQAPELELEYSFGPSVIEKTDTNYDGIGIPKKYAEYVDVSVKDAFSAYGDLTFYHVSYNSFKKTWVREEMEAGGSIRISQNGNGSFGFLGTSTSNGSSYNGIEFTTREFICAVDRMGNAVSAYPILTGSDKENTEDDSYYYGITDDSSFFETTAPVLAYDGLTYTIDFESSSDRLDYYTVQMDDRLPERVDLSQPSYYYESVANSAGLVHATGYGIDFYLPYEPDRAEGEEVTHRVEITAYGYGETPASQPVEKTVEYEITAQNVKPRVEVDTEYYENNGWKVGEVRIKMNAPVKDEKHGISAHSLYMTAYKNGTYWLTLTDQYGNEYQQELVVSGMPEDPVIDISTTEPTVGPVVIKVTSGNYLLATSAHPDEGGAGGCQTQPTVTGYGSKEMEISIPENCFFSICWGEDEETIHSNYVSMSINNIAKNTELSPAVQWCYDASMLEDGNILRGDRLRAVLIDKNGAALVDPQTGSMPYYEFVPGGATEYTFSGCQTTDGRTVPDTTAVLPVTLLPYETEAEDVDAPDLTVTGYVMRQGKSSQIPGVYLQSRLENAAVIYGYEDAYGAENIFSDMRPFLAKMSWANSYTFRVGVEDQSKVRLFVKQELSETAPDYETGTSDSIEGVSLTGRTLTVSQNVEFVVYAVDENGNTSVVPFQVTDLGDLPEPEYVKARTKAGDEVRIYLLKPEIAGISDLQITNDDNNDKVPDAKTEDDVKSAFYGMPYLSVKENGTVVLRYSFSYMGVTSSGSLTLEVNEIDMNPPAVKKDAMIWSANYDPDGVNFTNQEISLQMEFDKYLGDVTLTDAEGNVLSLAIPDGVTVSWLENRVTVVYDNNMPQFRLKAASAVNGKEVVVDLPAITTIDKTAPAVAVSNVAYSVNHRKAVITIISDEDGILSINGAQGRTFTQTVKENGTYTYTVTDRAGNQGQASVTVDELVTGELALALSTAGTEESVIDPETYEAKIGDILYAKTNRPVTLYLNGQPVKENMAAGTWESFTVGEDSEGLYPAIRAVDAYGNAALVQLLRIPMRDRKAPVLLVAKRQISASAEKTDEELRTLLLANVTCIDETTPADRLTVTVEFDRNTTESRIPVTYTVRDEAGNEAADTCWLRLNDGSEPAVTVNGKSIEWDETMAVQSGTETIRITSSGEPYKVSWKTGIKTEAQLKTGANTLGRNTGATEQELEIALDKPGYYTFCITTQGRKTYRFVLYVEE